MFEPGSDLPPPAYELSTEAFDQKIADAIEHSQREASKRPLHEEEWEEWDESIFEAAASTRARQDAQLQQQFPHAGGSQSLLPSSSSITTYPPEKVPFQQNYDEHYLNHDSGPSTSSASTYLPEIILSSVDLPASSAENSDITHAPGSNSAESGTHIVTPIGPIPDDDIADDTPPPPFTPQGPSLDGPPFEEVVMSPPELPVIPRGYYEPIPEVEALASTPLASSPTTLDSANVVLEVVPIGPSANFPMTPGPGVPAQSVEPVVVPQASVMTPTVSRVAGPRAAPFPKNAASSSSTTHVRIGFDPSVAYSRPRQGIAPTKGSQSAGALFPTASFYNSAVSPHIAPSAYRPQARRYGRPASIMTQDSASIYESTDRSERYGASSTTLHMPSSTYPAGYQPYNAFPTR